MQLAELTKFKVEGLPPEVRAEIDQWLVDREFHFTAALAAELRERGFLAIGPGAIRRYAKKIKRERAENRFRIARERMAIELEVSRKRLREES
jgi:hypothetical protein